jgi:catechol 2,3-dioxygenase-like lactoylglutathione lyase family enzyme
MQGEYIDNRLSLQEPSMSRIQLAINVDDLETSVDFYRRLFGTEPAKLRPGYANFAVLEPPLKLVLIENPGHGGSLNHLGVEVEDVDTVDSIQTRLAADGLASIDELLRQAGQVLGRGHAQRRAVGDLHRAGRQPHPERRGRRAGVLHPAARGPVPGPGGRRLLQLGRSAPWS